MSRRHKPLHRDRTARLGRVREHVPEPKPAAPAPAIPPNEDEVIRGRILSITRRPSGAATLTLDGDRRIEVPRALVHDDVQLGRWIRASVRSGGVAHVRVVGW